MVSPSGGGTLNTRTPTLVLRPSSGNYVTSSVSYEIQVLTTGGDVIVHPDNQRRRGQRPGHPLAQRRDAARRSVCRTGGVPVQ